MNTEMTTPDSDSTLWVVADRVRFLGGLPGSHLELIEVEVPPGSGVPPHTHASPEMFYMVEGELTVCQLAADGPPTEMIAGPGSVIRIASMAVHGYSNNSHAPVRMLVLTERAMTDFFRDIGTAEPQAEPDFPRLAAAMQRHGVEMLPPQPAD